MCVWVGVRDSPQVGVFVEEQVVVVHPLGELGKRGGKREGKRVGKKWQKGGQNRQIVSSRIAMNGFLATINEMKEGEPHDPKPVTPYQV